MEKTVATLPYRQEKIIRRVFWTVVLLAGLALLWQGITRFSYAADSDAKLTAGYTSPISQAYSTLDLTEASALLKSAVEWAKHHPAEYHEGHNFSGRLKNFDILVGELARLGHWQKLQEEIPLSQQSASWRPVLVTESAAIKDALQNARYHIDSNANHRGLFSIAYLWWLAWLFFIAGVVVSLLVCAKLSDLDWYEKIN